MLTPLPDSSCLCLAQATIGRLESELRELKMQLQHAKDEVSASAEALRSERGVSTRLQEEVTALRDENLALQVSMPLSARAVPD